MLKDEHTSCVTQANDTNEQINTNDAYKQTYKVEPKTARIGKETQPKKQATAKVNTLDTSHTLTNNTNPQTTNRGSDHEFCCFIDQMFLFFFNLHRCLTLPTQSGTDASSSLPLPLFRSVEGEKKKDLRVRKPQCEKTSDSVFPELEAVWDDVNPDFYYSRIKKRGRSGEICHVFNYDARV